MNRRSLLISSAGVLCSAHAFEARFAPSEKANDSFLAPLTDAPQSVTAYGASGAISLDRSGSGWTSSGIEIHTVLKDREQAISVRAPRTPLLRLHLRWRCQSPLGASYLGDAWERSYGDLAWMKMQPERVLPWYFLACQGVRTFGCGVKTGSGAFCFWQVDPQGISLWLDVRNGGSPVQLGDRELALASMVTEVYEDVTAFQAARQFCRRLCDKPRLPAKPVYGGNNWYYAYGKSSADDILRDSERVASWAPSSSENRPFMVIDDGWSENHTAGPWLAGNKQFRDMTRLAEKIHALGVEPGLWMRPLFTKETIAPEWRLSSPNAAREYAARQTYTLDPTVPEALAKISADVRRIASWGYGLIKHDFSTYDLLGRWGFAMGAALTDNEWHFADGTKTNAEVVIGLYQAIRDAAGPALVLGCNTVGHLAAGLFELQRIGDDTSGRDWNRTRKMGVNTLAFREPQHGAFFAVDADCVGLTQDVPWIFNRRWLQLLAGSGTPLFVSAAPNAVGAEQRAALQEAFAMASVRRPLAEPLDWLDNNEPGSWVIQGKNVQFDWYGKDGASPYSS